MPKQYKPLTNEEKEAIRKRNEILVLKTNLFFKANGIKPIDEKKAAQDLEDKMNNEEYVARYRISQEIQEKEAKQTEIIKDLSKDIKVPPARDYLSGSFKYYFKTDGSKESNEYNRKLYEAYAKNPEAITHLRVKKLMNYNPKPLLAAGNDKVKLMEYYRDNIDICHEANEFGDTFSREPLGMSREMKEASKSMKGLIQKINSPANIASESKDKDFFAMPELDKDQARAFFENNKKITGERLNPSQKAILARQKGEVAPMKSFADHIGDLKGKGLDFTESNFFLKYKAVETNPETNEKTEVSFDKVLNNAPNVEVKERSKEEITKINEVSKTFQNKYSMEFQRRMGEKMGKAYNIFNVQKDMAGGFTDRLFRGQSKEFKAYMSALADYTNPEKEGYLNKEKVIKAGADYFSHVNHDNIRNEMRAKRTDLVTNTLSVLAEMENDDKAIRNKINGEIASEMPKDPESIKRESLFGEKSNPFNLEEDEEVNENDKSVDLDLSIEDANLIK